MLEAGQTSLGTEITKTVRIPFPLFSSTESPVPQSFFPPFILLDKILNLQYSC